MRSYLSWLIAAVFVFFQFFLQSSATMMSEHWVASFGLNEIELSNVSAAFFYSYIPMQIPAGILYDKFDAKKILLYSAMTLAMSCLALAIVPNYELALVARFFMGLGAASGFVGLLKIIQSNFSRDKFVLMFGIAEALGMIGVALGLIGLASFLKYYSWQSAMVVAGIFAAGLAIAIFFFVASKENSNPRFSFKELFYQLQSILTNRQVIFCSIYGFFVFSIMTCFTSLWGEPYLTVAYQLDPETISLLLSMIFIGVAVGSPCNGWLVKKYGKHKELMLGEAGLSTLIAILIILVPGIPLYLLFPLYFLIGVFCSVSGACFALVNDAVDKKMQATAVSFANMVVIASAPILQLMIGTLLETHTFGLVSSEVQNYRIALSILPISYLIAFVVGFFVRPSRYEAKINNLPETI